MIDYLFDDNVFDEEIGERYPLQYLENIDVDT